MKKKIINLFVLVCFVHCFNGSAFIDNLIDGLSSPMGAAETLGATSAAVDGAEYAATSKGVLARGARAVLGGVGKVLYHGVVRPIRYLYHQGAYAYNKVAHWMGRSDEDYWYKRSQISGDYDENDYDYSYGRYKDRIKKTFDNVPTEDSEYDMFKSQGKGGILTKLKNVEKNLSSEKSKLDKASLNDDNISGDETDIADDFEGAGI